MVFEKLYKFIGKGIKNLIDRPDEPHCFRMHKNRVYYVRESLMKKATNVSMDVGMGAPCICAARVHCSFTCGWLPDGLVQPPAAAAACVPSVVGRLSNLVDPFLPCEQVARDKLVSLGTCFGKLTHSGKFRLGIGALDILSQHARHKVGGQEEKTHETHARTRQGVCLQRLPRHTRTQPPTHQSRCHWHVPPGMLLFVAPDA